MDTSLQILVIILSTALAILIVLAIVAVVLFIRILKAIGRITDKAEHFVQSAEQVGQALSNATGPLAVFKVVRNITELVTKHTAKDKRGS
jgi:hypothetical protein